MWWQRWKTDGTFCLLYAENELHCEIDGSAAGDPAQRAVLSARARDGVRRLLAVALVRLACPYRAQARPRHPAHRRHRERAGRPSGSAGRPAWASRALWEESVAAKQERVACLAPRSGTTPSSSSDPGAGAARGRLDGHRAPPRRSSAAARPTGRGRCTPTSPSTPPICRRRGSRRRTAGSCASGTSAGSGRGVLPDLQRARRALRGGRRRRRHAVAAAHRPLTASATMASAAIRRMGGGRTVSQVAPSRGARRAPRCARRGQRRRPSSAQNSTMWKPCCPGDIHCVARP